MIFGAVIKEDLEDEIQVTVIATGFEEEREPKRTSVRADKDDVKIDLRPFNVSDNLDIPTFCEIASVVKAAAHLLRAEAALGGHLPLPLPLLPIIVKKRMADVSCLDRQRNIDRLYWPYP